VKKRAENADNRMRPRRKGRKKVMSGPRRQLEGNKKKGYLEESIPRQARRAPPPNSSKTARNQQFSSEAIQPKGANWGMGSKTNTEIKEED